MTRHPFHLLLRTNAPEAPGGIVRLDERPSRPLTFVTGPTGWGKTVLLRLMAEAFTTQNATGHVVWLSTLVHCDGPNTGTDPDRVTVLRGSSDPRVPTMLADPHAALGLPAETPVLIVVDEASVGFQRSYKGQPGYVSLHAPITDFIDWQRMGSLVDHAGPARPGTPGHARMVLSSQQPLTMPAFDPEIEAATGTRVLAGRLTSTAWEAFAGPYREAVPAWAADQMSRRHGGYWVRQECGEPEWFPCRVTEEELRRGTPAA